MKALVTGATGFVGSHLVETLVRNGFQVGALVRKSSNLRWLTGQNVRLVWGDLGTQEISQEFLNGVEYVFHLAGVVTARSKKEYFAVNAEGTRFLLKALDAARAPVKRFVLLSSQAAAGPSINGKPTTEERPPQPVSYYGASKFEGEEIARQWMHRFPIVILRPPPIYGPREKNFFRFFKLVKRGVALLIGAKKRRLSLCYVQDVVNGIVRAAFASGVEGRTYFVSSPRAYTWEEIYKEVASSLKAKPLWIRLPRLVVYTVLIGGELYSKVFRKPVYLSWQRGRDMMQRDWICDSSCAEREFGYREETPLKEGIRITANWYQQAGWL